MSRQRKIPSFLRAEFRFLSWFDILCLIQHHIVHLAYSIDWTCYWILRLYVGCLSLALYAGLLLNFLGSFDITVVHFACWILQNEFTDISITLVLHTSWVFIGSTHVTIQCGQQSRLSPSPPRTPLWPVSLVSALCPPSMLSTRPSSSPSLLHGSFLLLLALSQVLFGRGVCGSVCSNSDFASWVYLHNVE